MLCRDFKSIQVCGRSVTTSGNHTLPRPFRFATHAKTGFAVTHRKQTVGLIPVRNISRPPRGLHLALPSFLREVESRPRPAYRPSAETRIGTAATQHLTAWQRFGAPVDTHAACAYPELRRSKKDVHPVLLADSFPPSIRRCLQTGLPSFSDPYFSLEARPWRI